MILPNDDRLDLWGFAIYTLGIVIAIGAVLFGIGYLTWWLVS